MGVKLGTNKFTWYDGDIQINPSCEIAVVIDGEPHPWYHASWVPEGDIDAAVILAGEMTGAPRFNPSERLEPDAPGEVEQVLLTDVGQWGIHLTALLPVPDGMATELRITGAVELTIPLG